MTSCNGFVDNLASFRRSVLLFTTTLDRLLRINMYYDFGKITSYNALLNFILGERGVGKHLGRRNLSLTTS